MDFCAEIASCNGSNDKSKEFANASSYKRDETFDIKSNGNVNNDPSQWPLRHNNYNESLKRHESLLFNGFGTAKKQRFTYTGRISRIPSRYLDTDSDSDDGNVRKDGGQNRLKTKRTRRRRKHTSNGSKLLINGFKKNEESLFFSVSELNVNDTGRNVGRKERLANMEYTHICDDNSPNANDKITHVDDETSSSKKLGKSFVHLNGATCLRSTNNSSVNELEIEDSTIFNSVRIGYSKSSGFCASTDKEMSGVCKEEAKDLKSEDNESYKNAVSNIFARRKCHSSTTVVRENDRSTDNQTLHTTNNVSSNSLPNDNLNDKTSENSEINLSFKVNPNTCKEEYSDRADLNDLARNMSRKKRLNRINKRSGRKILLNSKLKDTISFSSVGFNSYHNMEIDNFVFDNKMKGNVRKRRKGVVNGKVNISGAGNCGKISKQKRKLAENITTSKDDKTGKNASDLDRVLVMRKNIKGGYEFLVEWENGTSCWVSSNDIIKDKHNYWLRQYLVECEQDVSVVNRVPFQAYCCDSLSLKHCKSTIEDIEQMLCVGNKTAQSTTSKRSGLTIKIDDQVSVKYKANYCYISLHRDTCTRTDMCMKNMMDLIDALEDASNTECDVVVVEGLQGALFCGLDLHDMLSKRDERENAVLSKAR